MARNGSGTQTSPVGSFPAVTGTVISSTSFNNIVNDINSEITKSIANDGQTPITANLPMSGFKHTGVAAANASGQYMEYAQVNTLLAAKADLASPTFTGTPAAPTATAGTNTTQIATTAFVAASFAKSGANTDITSLNAPSLGSATATTQTAGDNSTKVATTAYVDSAGGSSKIQPITASVGSNALTLTLNATKLDFRSSTLSSGTINTRTISSPINVVVSSGSTLGTINATAARLVIIAIDNAGTVELAVTNLAGGLNLDETTLISTTAEGGAGAADSANVIYSTTARANVPFRVVGFVDITETTAGTWASAPTTIQGVGGQALAALSSLGYGQTWQSVTRAMNTTYYNTTGRPIELSVTGTGTNGASILGVSINGGSAVGFGLVVHNSTVVWGTIIIPAGVSYSLSSSVGTISLSGSWELR